MPTSCRSPYSVRNLLRTGQEQPISAPPLCKCVQRRHCGGLIERSSHRTRNPMFGRNLGRMIRHYCDRALWKRTFHKISIVRLHKARAWTTFRFAGCAVYKFHFWFPIREAGVFGLLYHEPTQVPKFVVILRALYRPKPHDWILCYPSHCRTREDRCPARQLNSRLSRSCCEVCAFHQPNSHAFSYFPPTLSGTDIERSTADLSA